jgi:hypothetical protein
MSSILFAEPMGQGLLQFAELGSWNSTRAEFRETSGRVPADHAALAIARLRPIAAHSIDGRFSGRPFCLRDVIAVTVLREALCLNRERERGWATRSFRDVLSPTAT